jgi:hypothetical protein
MGCVDWIDMAQDRDQWRVLVNTVSNFRVSQERGAVDKKKLGTYM